MSETPIDLDKHRGMAAQKATDIRRVLADVETSTKRLRDHQAAVERQLLAVPATSWPEAVAKARYVLNLYAADLAPTDMHHRDLVTAVLADLTRLAGEG
jgi:ABC-type transporter Mla subunit MlaD